MHELSIALSVVESVAGHVAAHGGGRVAAVTLRIGALSGVDPAALRFAFPEAARGTALDGALLVIDPVAAAAWCPRCEAERPLGSVQRMRCPVCAAPTPRLIRGRELEILAVEVT